MPRFSPPTSKRVNALPHPRSRIDPAHVPFVGNATVDENLVEAVEVAIWNVLGKYGIVQVECAKGVVTLSGELDDTSRSSACERVAAEIAGVGEVKNCIRIRQAAETPLRRDVWQAEAEQLVLVVRYCGTTDASLSSAIRDAIATLDAALGKRGIAPPTSLFVIYRNRQHDTMTLEIGMPVPRGAEVEPNLAGHSPAGATMSWGVGSGVERLILGCEALSAHARACGYEPSHDCWQRFDLADFRPWVTLPASVVNIGVTPRV